ncbi:MAG: hypothetical protein QXT31_03975 [Candidatus Bathyarchaeia archaeon]
MELKYCPECGKPLKPKKDLLAICFIGILLMTSLFLFWQLTQVNNQLAQKNAQITELNNQIIQLNNQIDTLNTQVSNLQAYIDRLSTENKELKRYRLNHFQSLDELKRFLANSQISERKYSYTTYNCINFAKDLKIEAREKGYNLSFVIANYRVGNWLLGYEEASHAFNAALINGNLVYIEPQNDRIYNSMEELLASLWVWQGRYGETIPATPNDITIYNYEIIW